MPLVRRIVTAGLAAALVTAPVPAMAAVPAPESATTKTQSSDLSAIDRAALSRTLGAVVEAGMYGTYSTVREGREEWRGAAGVADVHAKRPVRPGLLHRVGSITKTFTAVAVLQQVARGAVDLDAPIARYLPDLGERGRTVTVRMVLNHTSGIGDYVLPAFPSLARNDPASLFDNRFLRRTPAELVRFGLDAPPTGAPGERWSYSNTNYIIAGLLLEKVTRTPAEVYITKNVIGKAGLKHTSFPRTPVIPGPHSKAYENLYGLIDPPRDFSVYDMSWAGTAGAVVSTMEDLNAFYRALLTGRILGERELAEMRRTVPVYDEQGNVVLDYGLGLYRQATPCGGFWGHDGAVFGHGTMSLSSEDGRRQISMGVNLMKYQRIGEDGRIQPHPIDFASADHLLQALCGPGSAVAPEAPGARSAPAVQVFPTSRLWGRAG
ncbi:serine hydrolase domain-containing protein [Spongiactinospora sp. TRM90649]|uniref:serine hydrolase domain-containing protein n=1 Tax=Spongiactinospora sp. TRM90649 TaxID=3031114 RepID=UPI0023F8CA5A|nr:serine hydrolase domain-containing protein [Spongiactinospora sp. TRM90649]MDF5756986.1 serine hydrolase [Spongiactinospora sp. TRM90649]